MRKISQEQIEQLETWIRTGHGDFAREFLLALPHGGRELEPLKRSEVARLYRRVGLPERGLRHLRPHVRLATGMKSQATHSEKAEYAAALIAVGATSEGLILLKEVDVAFAPEALLYEAFGLFTRWNYAAAIPALRKYMAAAPSDYARLLAKVNLAAALVTERSEEAWPFLIELHEETTRGDYRLLRANSLELMAQACVFRSDWTEARSRLAEASQNLGDGATIDEFFTAKWSMILDLLESGGSVSALMKTEAIRKRARECGHLETLRECDLFEAVATQNQDLLARVYFGTPFPHYRQRVLKQYGDSAQLPQTYDFRPEDAGPTEFVLDLEENGVRQLDLKPMQLLHRLLLALASDFYRPQSTAGLHAELFPDQWYNPDSSPGKIHQLITRLRKWMQAKQLPISVSFVSGGFQLQLESGTGLRINRNLLKESVLTPIQLLKTHASAEPFAVRDVTQWLGIPLRTASRLLSEALLEGKLDRVGSGRATQYHFTDQCH